MGHDRVVLPVLRRVLSDLLRAGAGGLLAAGPLLQFVRTQADTEWRMAYRKIPINFITLDKSEPAGPPRLSESSEVRPHRTRLFVILGCALPVLGLVQYGRDTGHTPAALAVAGIVLALVMRLTR
jgi:hypothetical protein